MLQLLESFRLSPANGSELGVRLEGLTSAQALLVKARCDPRPFIPPGWQVWPLVNGPSAWVFGLHREPGAPRLEALREEHRAVDPLYHEAIRQASAGDPACLETAARLEEHLERHLRREEEWLYPLARRHCFDDDRVLREMGYEHRGIRAGLLRLKPVLSQTLTGQASRKDLEKLELDLLHMFEHHQEHEEEALYPWIEAVAAELLDD